MSCMIDDSQRLKQELIKAHISKKGLHVDKVEEDFISFAQTLPHYGGHFYTATWVSNSQSLRLIHIQSIRLRVLTISI